ncbi:MAG TPA: hypothetical protein VFU46_04705 [Gemmatimonadales bacterium]|nr:hypothetical protein [Gemmatimonadales bacterium]
MFSFRSLLPAALLALSLGLTACADATAPNAAPAPQFSENQGSNNRLTRTLPASENQGSNN